MRSARWTNFATWKEALHRAGIGVILDVVFNHTAEATTGHAQFSRRGPARTIILDPTARVRQLHRRWEHAQHQSSIVRRLIADSLRYWVEVMRGQVPVRSASILARDSSGRCTKPPVPT
jgi:glycogen operon protein